MLLINSCVTNLTNFWTWIYEILVWISFHLYAWFIILIEQTNGFLVKLVTIQLNVIIDVAQHFESGLILCYEHSLGISNELGVSATIWWSLDWWCTTAGVKGPGCWDALGYLAGAVAIWWSLDWCTAAGVKGPGCWDDLGYLAGAAPVFDCFTRCELKVGINFWPFLYFCERNMVLLNDGSLLLAHLFCFVLFMMSWLFMYNWPILIC